MSGYIERYDAIIPDQPTLRATSSGYGITMQGFSRMRFPEIREEIFATLYARTGLRFESRPDSITGEFVDTFAEREAALWELCEATYHAMYPCSAFGTNLDHAVSFAGVVRLFARQSTALCVLYGVEGTLVPQGYVVKENINRYNLVLDTDVTISQTNAIDATIGIYNVIDGAVYTVTVNNVVYSVTATFIDDAISIAAALGQELLITGLNIEVDAYLIRIFMYENIPFSIVATPPNVVLEILGSPGRYTAIDYGPIRIPPQTVTLIVSTVTGFERINNLIPGTIGREDETDDELRRRYNTGVFRLGAATLPAIYANLLQNIPSIFALRVFENVQDIYDNEGRPPHCIEVVCWGGDATIIANEIWLLKAGGISTFGSVMVQVTDPSGYPHDIYFNRPVLVYIWVHIYVTKYAEETFPPDGVQQIQYAVSDTGNLLGIDEDVIIQRFMGPIYRTVTGIERLDISIIGSFDPSYVPQAGDYTNNTVPIGPRQLSRFEEYRVEVIVL